jgi:hypothetical protein
MQKIEITGPDGDSFEIGPGQDITLSYESSVGEDGWIDYETLAGYIAAQR